MILVTQNIEKILVIFGESILLHKIPFEKQNTYQNKESYFWAKVC